MFAAAAADSLEVEFGVALGADSESVIEGSGVVGSYGSSADAVVDLSLAWIPT